MTSTEHFLAAFVLGERPDRAVDHSAEFAHRLHVDSEYHGVRGLVYEQLRASSGTHAAHLEARGLAGFEQACRETALRQTMWELRHAELLTRVLSHLDQAGVRPVLFKGTALAYSIYPKRALRPRGDTDFIVPADAVPALHAVLESLGFARELTVSGEHISYQASYTWTGDTSGDHSLDVHWRINNSEVLSRLFTYDELRARALPLTGLSPQALAACPVDALLIACMHRATHRQNPYYVDGVAYYGGDRLIWFYDIHLLLAAMSADEQLEFVRLAKVKGLSAVCLDAIECAQTYFFSQVAPTILAALRASAANETPARYLDGGPLRQKWMDFWALRDTGERLTYIKELLLPSEAYMRLKYVDSGQSSLAALYARRTLGGLKKTAMRVVSKAHP